MPLVKPTLFFTKNLNKTSAGTDTAVYIAPGTDEPGMILQLTEGRVWPDLKMLGKPSSLCIQLIGNISLLILKYHRIDNAFTYFSPNFQPFRMWPSTKPRTGRILITHGATQPEYFCRADWYSELQYYGSIYGDLITNPS